MEETALTSRELYRKAQREIALSRLDTLPTEIDIPLPSQWAADNRYLPPGVTDFYGQFDPMVAPHLNEPLNRLHPDDPCTHIAMMKSVQSANTTTIGENGMGFYIRYKLGSILFLTSTKGIGAIRGSANIDTLIDNSNLAELVKPMSNRTGRKTKDTAMYKEFSGGIKLLISSYNSIGDLKSNTFHFIIRDEWDEAPMEVKDQGDIAGIIEGRTKGVRNFKILDISTPSRAETSRIYKSFMEGDQREYFTPCPLCGEEQILILKGKGEDYGLTFTREKDKLTGNKILLPETVRYTCQYCKEDFTESKKQWMLESGIWRPQAVPSNKKKHSYHSTGLIAPEPFLSWGRICQDFIDTDFGQDLMKFKDFTINDLGNPWLTTAKAAKWSDLKKRAENYIMGIAPGGQEVEVSGVKCFTGPLFLAAGSDIQGDRIECLVVGFGFNGNKWVIDHRVFYGNTADIDDPCWELFSNFIYNQTYSILQKNIIISSCAVDAGWNPRAAEKRDKDYSAKAHIVYEFVSTRTDKFIATMGNPNDKANGIMKSSKISDTKTSLSDRYMISVSILKELIMGVIDNTEGHNCIHVPASTMLEGEVLELEDEFFMQFLSEVYRESKKKPGEYGWFKIRNRNEIFDMFIYAIGAAERYNISSNTREDWSNYYLGLLTA